MDWTAPLPSGNLLTAMGLAIVVVLSSFDGWYQARRCAPVRSNVRSAIFRSE